MRAALAAPAASVVALAAALFAAPPAGAQGEPLSAIDWLSRSVEATEAAPPGGDASAPAVTTTPLAAGEPALLGALPPAVTGLPPDLWAGSDVETLRPLILAEPVHTLPALQDLTVTLLLAQAAPPREGGARQLLLARVDRLLDMGAIEAARSLLESGDLHDAELFRRWFDVTLLTGTEHDACEALRTQPSLAPTLPARVFCLARNGDWNAAALTLGTARALGDVTPDEDRLLSTFLDPDLGDDFAAALPPTRPSPLTYRLREAVGQLAPTAGLPLAFSHADLRDTVAWRAQIEAAERLARHGVLSENLLLGVYTARAPAASGGVWDRAAAVQRLDRALAADDAGAVASALPAAWSAMTEAGLAVPFARLFGERLAALRLEGEAGRLAWRVALLSPAYEAAARARTPANPREAVWRAVATGEVEGVRGPDATATAILAGFADPEIPAEIAAAVENGQLGEAILQAIAAFERGLDGDLAGLTGAIAALRALGLEDAARRAALQALLLDGAA